MLDLGNDIEVIKFILCEEVRQEIGNKHSILGAIAGDLSVSVYPSTIKVAGYFDLYVKNPGKYVVEYNILVNGESQGTAKSDFEVAKPTHVVAIVGPLTVPVAKPGPVVFEAFIPGSKPIKVDERKLL